MVAVSFIVPAHNEQQLLGRTLAALHAAAREVEVAYEVVVVSDSSTDDTAAIARAHGARVIEVAHRQIAATRNAGARAALGARLIFVDADTVVPAETLRATLAAWRSGVVAGGASVHLDGRLPLAARLSLPPFRLAMRLARLAAGCYVFCTREAFDGAGGFDTRLFAGEELAFSRSLWSQGPVRVLREPVYSSGRKLRTHSSWEITQLFLNSLRGPGLVRSRRHLALWYGERREDPEGL
jgi:cellulose synthase/poly-beta-1,6-N-acetylglucosamine synthase-like glycosyltransferase